MTSEKFVAGIDSSTQSTKILLVRADDGAVMDEASAPHPAGTEVDPRHWWEALTLAGTGLLGRASAVAVAGQQHGMVALDDAHEVVRPALLWNDLRSAAQAREVVDHFGGPQPCARTIGTVPTAAITVTKLRWMHHHEPGHAARTSAVLLPHDYLTWRLGGRKDFVTDHGDASGTGYYSPAERRWLPEVAAWGLGRSEPPSLPRVAEGGETVGQTQSGAVLAAGTGDNMAAAMGLATGPGDVVVSIGTSGAVFASAAAPSADAAGYVCGFADATGRYLPLVCTINAARVMTTTARLLGVSLQALAELALRGRSGANGVTVLPYLDGERTPNRPGASGVFHGITSATEQSDLARAAIEGLLCSLADAVDALPVRAERILLIGGGARNRAVCEIAPTIFGVPVTVPEPAEYVARGAARQAAWALFGDPEPPTWPEPHGVVFEGPPAPGVREQYAALRDRTGDWEEPRAGGA